MTMIFNGTELGGVVFNGVACDAVYMNGVLVFSAKQIQVGTIIPNEVWGTTQIGGNPYPPIGNLLSLRWGWDESPPPYPGWIRLACSDTSHQGRIRVTIGGVVRVLEKYGANSDWGLVQSPAEYGALPKSGAHTLKIEAIP